MRKPKLALVLVTALLASCSTTIPTRTFEIRAINDENDAVKCLVVVDRKWPSEGDTPIYTPATVDVVFTRDRMTIAVKAVTVDDEGNIKSVPTELSPSDYKLESRDLRLGDPGVHLFILRRDYSR